MMIGHGRRSLLKERIRRFLGGLPPRVQVAALPWRVGEDGGGEVLLVTSRGSGRWVLPKGWPEKRERLFEAAAREAAEEAGVTGVVARDEIGRFYYGKAMPSGSRWRCEVRVFALQVETVADTWPERKHRKRRWLSPQEAASLVDEADLAELIASFAGNPRKFTA
ncbi:MAG: NUDIX hydrolase [Hyphomicrobiales bacterium]|nr:MAG: NUDIX hydrolase [Hyphomicrobiales bacterium]